MIDRISIIACAKRVFDTEISGLEKTRDSLGDAFVRTVELLLKTSAAGGLAVVTGVGKSLHIAEKMSGIFSSTGLRSVVLNPVQAMHGDLGMTSSADALLALSFSGESEEVVKLVPAIRRHGLKIVALTGNPESSLAKLSDIVLEIPCGAEACPFGMAPTNSATATMAMGDALAMSLVEARKFTIKEYAGNHPAGAIGRALVLKVHDVMRKGENFAAVMPGSTVMETVMAMTAAKTGSAVVVDDDGRLKGIFTDGDFRRAVSVASGMSGGLAELLASPVSRYMTVSPKFISGNAYAVELLKVFEKKSIDDLPVVDDDGKVVGVVDIQDLPKMKVI